MTIGLDGRARDVDGTIHKKHKNTLVGTLRRIYGKYFAKGHRPDMKLGTLLKEQHAVTLSDYLKRR